MPLGRLLALIFGLSLALQATTHPLPIPNATPRTAVSLPGARGVPGTAVPVNVPATPKGAAPVAPEAGAVSRVIDGDTIELASGEKIRYIGINTPETVDPRKTVQCFGVEASNANKSLVQGQVVRLEKDISETDKYGRLLRYVWIGDTFVNDYLVRQGFARSSSYPPDVKYQDQFVAAETEARSSNRGLWSSCAAPGAPVTQPLVGTASKTPPDPACPIKGNISSGGKIYHLPGQRFYKTTVIDPSAGERWFCSEAEAVGAGWRRSKL